MKLKLLAVAVAAAISSPVFAEGETNAKASKGFTVNDQDVTFTVGGRLQFDYDWFDGDAFANGDTSGSDSELRRSRIFIKGKVGKDWEGKLQADFKDNGGTKLADAYLKYKGWDSVDVTLGNFNAPFGLEENVSSKDITAIERSMASGAFDPGRDYGVQLSKASKDFTWAIAVQDAGEESGNVATQVTGRLTFAPIVSKDEVFHLGAGIQKRRLAGNNYDGADQRLDVHLADEKVGAGSIAGESLNVYNFEIAYAAGPFHAQAEYFDGEVTEVNGSMTGDTDLSGYYATVGYILTGESRPYKNGVFKRVTPKGKDGAWEVFGRWSSYEPGADEAEALTLGLNYYANTAVRIGLNYVMGDLTEGGVDKDGNALSVRFQYVF